MDRGWQIRNIYLYLVSFVTLMMVVFGFISFLNSLSRYLLAYEYGYFISLMDIEKEYTASELEVPPLEELERLRQDRMDNNEARDRAYRLRELISSLAVWVTALPFYLYHWKKIRLELLSDGGGAVHET